MRPLFSIAALVAAFLFPVIAQSQNLSGIWQGTARQMDGATAHAFSYTLYIVQNGDQLTGTNWSYLDGKPSFSEKTFTAAKTGDLVSFQEGEILGENPAENGLFWGISYGNFRHDPETDEIIGELVFPKNSATASTDAGQPSDFLRATVRLAR